MPRTISLDGSETKNEEPLLIPIATPAYEALKEAMKVTHLNTLLVFCHPDGKPYTAMQVHRAFKDALKAAEIKDFGSTICGTVSPHGTDRREWIWILWPTSWATKIRA